MWVEGVPRAFGDLPSTCNNGDGRRPTRNFPAIPLASRDASPGQLLAAVQTRPRTGQRRLTYIVLPDQFHPPRARHTAVIPTLPIVAQLVAAGHKVTYYTSDTEHQAAVETVGAEHRVVTPLAQANVQRLRHRFDLPPPSLRLPLDA